ncbi:MAG TPA: WG repeat-containing protein, partial [Hanamia sp.]|nr:WG repeat-containing protein [Hanamia sp.]
MRCILTTLAIYSIISFANAQTLTVFEDQNKKGFKDQNGNIVIPARYSDTYPFRNGYAKVAVFNENIERQYGFIDKTGKEIIPLKYTYLADEFSEGMLAAEKNKKWGFINAKNETVIPFVYQYARNFSEGLAAVRSKDKWGFITSNNNVKIPFMYNEVKSFKEARCAVSLYDKWGFINEVGTQLIPFKYDEVGYGGFSGGLTGVKQFDKWAVINADGKALTAFKYQSVESSYYNPSLSIIKVGIMPTQSSYVYGVVDSKGTEIIPLKYSGIDIYDYNVIVAKMNGKSGVLNIKNKEMLPFEYSGIYMLKDYAPNGVIYKIGESNNTRVFSLEGDKINIWKYEMVQDESEGLRAAMYKNKWGFFNATGAEAVPFIYDTVTNFYGGYAFVKLNKKVGYIDKSGKQIIPIKYDAIYN